MVHVVSYVGVADTQVEGHYMLLCWRMAWISSSLFIALSLFSIHVFHSDSVTLRRDVILCFVFLDVIGLISLWLVLKYETFDIFEFCCLLINLSKMFYVEKL